MLLVKFKKVGSFAFCSYLNCRDVIIQTIKRAGISIEYSQGFNPHELLYFSPPTSLGIESECEYFTVYTNDIDNFVAKFNEKAPSGVQALWAKEINKRPDFYNLVDFAKFEIEVLSPDLLIDLNKLNYIVFDDKKQCDVDIEKLIKSISFNDNKFECIVSCGQKNNLKIMNLVKCLKQSYSLEIQNIKKIELYKENLKDDCEQIQGSGNSNCKFAMQNNLIIVDSLL